MSLSVQRFPYLIRDPLLGDASLSPMLPMTLMGQNQWDTTALVDSGASVNVLPYSMGLQLGFAWNQETRSVQLTGLFHNLEARVVLVTAVIGTFQPLRLAFAWAREDTMGVILGQVNFFMEMEVCFFRSQKTFQLRPKT